MKGLLLKELYSAAYKSLLIPVLGVCGAFLAMSLKGLDYLFFWFYPVFFCSMIPFFSMQREEASHWQVYCDTLPYSRAQIVSAKYVTTMICSLGSALIIGCVHLTRISFETGFPIFCLMTAFGICTPALIYPFIFALGVAKGMIAYYVICVLVGVVGVGGASRMAIVFGEEGSGKLPVSGLEAGLMILLATGAVLVVSWFVSVKVYQRREL